MTRIIKKTLHKITPARRAIFLETLTRTGHVTAACAAAGVSLSGTYSLRKRDGTFARAWEEALETAVGTMMEEARRRGVEGWDEPVFYKGEPVGAIRRYSDRLLIQLLQAHKPELFRPHPEHETAKDDILIAALRKARRRVEAGRKVDAEHRDE
jgi:hypothetical protein